MKILNQKQIAQKIKRLAIQILENNFDAKEIVLAGINNNGSYFAKLLHDYLSTITKTPITLTSIKLNPADPLASDISIDIPLKKLKKRPIIIVDDVANTGRTIFFALKPLFEVLPKKIEVAVLVDRKHKAFPIQVDYVGISLATTLKENIDVRLKTKEMAVYLN